MSKKALVIGGGIAGINAAVELANNDKLVILVEKNGELGGNVNDMAATFPELDEAQPLLDEQKSKVEDNENIDIKFNSEVISVSGKAGDFKVEINEDGNTVAEEVGAIIVATGFNYMEPNDYSEYGYSRLDNVVTSQEYERMVMNGDIKKYSNSNVVFVHCVGSRDRVKGYRYCSKICCTYSAKHALLLKQEVPSANAFVFYIDIRALGKGYEEFIRDAIEDYGVRYIRGRVSKVINKEDTLLVKAENSLIGNPVELNADLVVLASAMEPQKDSKELAEILGIETDDYGFYKEAQSNMEPVKSSKEGIFLAGSCTAPLEIRESVAMGKAAASESLSFLG
ncbi:MULTISPECIES: CoB--CoM heterodisulfide reductase iron-sulfur subunit A family protein [unclassified Candidatus Frackibacter]|jgi:heterodisulfide reductase subunit A|uniref:CoB--CoM heterodisulfide reductase iron-sulfur subunit A family protein n=1 Tax=unclassified Candidatus Frackibacter TaxID=2648818 RepID=UPI000883BE92|nr:MULTISPECIES: FAD-dependent oxidoreductase [unclassified Candidatus Frackibacter]SDC20723.1 heterodisulfide reductase subunit A [Candidatus Frackibacter sp. WG11]SEM50999.1 heterodisulfide reductase subunit A [Candidatus Frackibacter sp. WG12]SFL52306.1 heterodisulfide reductase subunit A [Candidatus Frackibacter sp. WG13]